MDWLRSFSTLLEVAGLPAVVIGGHARNFWAEPRTTFDFDFTVVADPIPFRRVVDDLIARGYEITRNQEPNAPSGPDFVQMTHPDGTVVEFQAAKTPFQEEMLTRGKPLEKGQVLLVATPEDVLVMKLIANRRKDHRDLLDLGARPDIDWEYVERWCKIWDLSHRLRDLRADLNQQDAQTRELYRDP